MARSRALIYVVAVSGTYLLAVSARLARAWNLCMAVTVYIRCMRTVHQPHCVHCRLENKLLLKTSFWFLRLSLPESVADLQEQLLILISLFLYDIT